MAEYNMQYINLKKRLKTLKLVIESDMSLDSKSKNAFVKKINDALIELDERYSEGRLLGLVENAIKEINV